MNSMRRFLLLVLALAPLACAPVPAPAAERRAAGATLDTVALARAVAALERDARGAGSAFAPARLGVAVRDLATGEAWSYRGRERFPLQSVFKAPLGAAVLAQVEAGRLRLDDVVTLTAADLSPPYSFVSAAFPARTRYTIEELVVAAAGGSDNTAADVLLDRIGGPQALNAYLAAHGVTDVRVDRAERELQVQIAGMGRFPRRVEGRGRVRAGHARGARGRATSLHGRVPGGRAGHGDARGRGAFPRGLHGGELLRPEGTARLLRIMTETRTGAARLKAALPAGATLAHKTGSARPDVGLSPVVNDIGIVALPGGRTLAVAVFLAGSPLAYAGAEQVHADVLRAVLASL